MKVVLLKNIANLGRAVDIKDVNDGFARNYLIPKDLASLVGRQDIFIIKSQAGRKARLKQEEEKNKLKSLKKINGLSFKIIVKADDTGTLYAKIDKNEITSELVKSGFRVEPKEILLPEPIKKTGQYEVSLMMQDEKATITLEIISE